MLQQIKFPILSKLGNVNFRENLLQHLQDALAHPKTEEALVSWKYPSPSRRKDHLWHHVHHALPIELIPSALTSILEKWEFENNHFTKAMISVIDQCTQMFQELMDEILQVEQELRAVGTKDSTSVPLTVTTTPYDVVILSVRRSFSKMQMFGFESDETPTHQYTSILHIMMSAMMKSTEMRKPSEMAIKCKCVEQFTNHQKSFIQDKAHKVLEIIRESEETVNELVCHDQEPAIEYVQSRQMQLSEAITTNLQLIQTLKTEVDSQAKRDSYCSFIQQITDVLDEVLKFYYKYLEQFEFSADSLVVDDTNTENTVNVLANDT